MGITEIRVIIKGMNDQLEMSQVTTTDWMMRELLSVSELLNDLDFEAKEEREEVLNKLREEYFFLAKKKPFGAWKEQDLKDRIAGLREMNKLSDETLRSKKSGFKNNNVRANRNIGRTLDKPEERVDLVIKIA